MTSVDKESIRQAYNRVRDDKSENNWAVMKYEGNQIKLVAEGIDFDEFKSHFTDSERVFGYLRMYTGDELSKRSKFALIAWIGKDVSALKRARIGVDKSQVKEIISNFAIEFSTSDIEEISEERIKEMLIKAGGANYGTGVR